MSDDYAIQVDTKRLEVLFNELDPKHLRYASRSAFNKAGRIILNGVKEEYRGMFPGSVLQKDIHMKAYRSGKGVMVDLLYTKRHSKGDALYKSYVMKILELGNYKGKRISKGNYKAYRPEMSSWSNQRWISALTAARADRGNIKAYHFFKKGTEATQERALQEINNLLEQAMQKQVAKAG